MNIPNNKTKYVTSTNIAIYTKTSFINHNIMYFIVKTKIKLLYTKIL